MDTQVLKHIYDIVTYGSITRAAQINFISPSQLSRQLKKIEDQLSIVIFERSSCGMQLTKQGQDFIAWAEPVLNSVSSFENRFHLETLPQDVFSFRIALHHNSMANQAVITLFNQIVNDYDFVDIISDSYNSVEEVLNAMSRCRYPLGVIQYNSTNAAKIAARIKSELLKEVVISRVKSHVLVSSSHPLRGCTTVSEKELAPYARIYFIDENLSYFNDYSNPNAAHFGLVRKRILIRERGQLFHYLHSSEAYYIGTCLCPSCSECQNLIDIPLETGNEAEIITSVICTEKQAHSHFIQLISDIAREM